MTELLAAAGGSMTMWARVRIGTFDGVDDIFRLGHGSSKDWDIYSLEFTNGFRDSA